MSSCALQKSSAPTSAAEYKKTDEPQPDVKEEAEDEEDQEKETGLIDKNVTQHIQLFLSFFLS